MTEKLDPKETEAARDKRWALEHACRIISLYDCFGSTVRCEDCLIDKALKKVRENGRT